MDSSCDDIRGARAAPEAAQDADVPAIILRGYNQYRFQISFNVLKSLSHQPRRALRTARVGAKSRRCVSSINGRRLSTQSCEAERAEKKAMMADILMVLTSRVPNGSWPKVAPHI